MLRIRCGESVTEICKCILEVSHIYRGWIWNNCLTSLAEIFVDKIDLFIQKPTYCCSIVQHRTSDWNTHVSPRGVLLLWKFVYMLGNTIRKQLVLVLSHSMEIPDGLSKIIQLLLNVRNEDECKHVSKAQ